MSYPYDDIPFSTLVGKTLTAISPAQAGDDEIRFTVSPGEIYSLKHLQACCESVSIESIVGDLSDLVGEPILMAEESSGEIPDAGESGTWTFYKLATRKGYVDIRWCGYSNGCYSEAVSFLKVST